VIDSGEGPKVEEGESASEEIGAVVILLQFFLDKSEQIEVVCEGREGERIRIVFGVEFLEHFVVFGQHVLSPLCELERLEGGEFMFLHRRAEKFDSLVNRFGGDQV